MEGPQREGAEGIKFLAPFSVSLLAKPNWNSEGKGARCTPENLVEQGGGVGLEGQREPLDNPEYQAIM